MKIHHVGYLVSDINVALKEFLELGYEIMREIIYEQLSKKYFY